MTQFLTPIPRIDLLAADQNQIKSDQHPVLVYLARLAPGSRRTMKQAINSIAQWLSGDQADALTFPWADLRYQHTAAIRARLAEKFSAATANKMLAALRGVLQEAWRLGLMSTEDYGRAVDIVPVRGSTLPRGRALSSGEIRAIFRECAQDQRLAGRRDAALVAVLYGCGLRRSEVVMLNLTDYQAEDASLSVRAAKGNKDRMVYLPNGAQQALEAWLEVRGRAAGSLFVAINKGSNMVNGRMADHAVMQILYRRAKSAGVTAFSPHDLRRTFISDMLDAGADISNVQQLAGHANIQTTIRYDRRGEAAKKKTAELLHIPLEG